LGPDEDRVLFRARVPVTRVLASHENVNWHLREKYLFPFKILNPPLSVVAGLFDKHAHRKTIYKSSWCLGPQ
jgi:hypothetical protein